MNNLYIFPQKIYLDSTKTIQRLKDIFVIGEQTLAKLSMGEWFDVARFKLKDKYVEENTKMLKNDKNMCFNNDISQKQCWDMPKNIEYVVCPMDTFKSVAIKLNISENLLRKCAKTKYLYVGQKITIQFA